MLCSDGCCSDNIIVIIVRSTPNTFQLNPTPANHQSRKQIIAVGINAIRILRIIAKKTEKNAPIGEDDLIINLITSLF